MKKTFTLFLGTLLTINSYAQIEPIGKIHKDLKPYLVQFSEIEDMYLAFDTAEIVLYSLNLTEYQRFTHDPENEAYWRSYLFNISDKLFNLDDKIEFLIYHQGYSFEEVKIINNEGTVLKKWENAKPYNWGHGSYYYGDRNLDEYYNSCIKSSTNGTFLYLLENDSISIYKLPGSLPKLTKDSISYNLIVKDSIQYNIQTRDSIQINYLKKDTIIYDTTFIEIIEVNSSSINIKQQLTNLGINVYPNPTRDKLVIESSSVINKVTVFNLSGQSIFTFFPNSTSVNISKYDLQGDGTYIFKVETDFKITDLKVVVN